MRKSEIGVITDFLIAGYFFKFPGGSERQIKPRHASFGVIECFDDEKCVVMIAYNEDKKYEIKKIVGEGKPELQFKEHPLGVLEREIREKTGIRIHAARSLGYASFQGHTKYGYTIKHNACDFSEVKTVPSKQWLGEPIAIPLSYLLEDNRWQRIIHNSHRWLFERAFEHKLKLDLTTQ